MDLNAVQMFVSVVQSGSLSAGAVQLGLPLPTVSRRIRELERQLKVQLLERSVRGTRLTDAGSRLYKYASCGIEALQEAEQAVVSDQERLRGRLRLSLPPAFEPWWELLSLFQQRYPEVQLHVFSTERRVDLVEDSIDVALRVGAIVHETIVARRVLSYRHVLVAGRHLIDRLGVPESVDSLHHYPCATWSSGASSVSRWSLGEEVFEPRSMLTTNDYAHLRNRALAGDVVTELPLFLATPHLQNDELVSLLPDKPMPELQIHLLYPSHRHPSSIVRAYLDFCQQQVPLLVPH
ncbi:LysR family transcriptional regulator [Enterobacter sp. 22452]|uniref:LysR family transcriptional regulator n=1 Tax=Enterobacter TaxID=547 RepID=UPI003F85A709